MLRFTRTDTSKIRIFKLLKVVSPATLDTMPEKTRSMFETNENRVEDFIIINTNNYYYYLVWLENHMEVT